MNSTIEDEILFLMIIYMHCHHIMYIKLLYKQSNAIKNIEFELD